jgi:hypothetical protein
LLVGDACSTAAAPPATHNWAPADSVSCPPSCLLAVTLETTSNFQNIKDLLMGFVNSVVLVLQRRLQPQRDQIWDAILNKSGNAEGAAGGSADSAAAPGGTGTSSALAGLDQSRNIADSGATMDSSLNAKPVVVKRSCTEAMLKVLQHEIRKTHAKSQAHEWIEELSLIEIVGKGGFGVVYKGTWKGSVAAVKVMYARQHERQAMKDALEMAVLTTVSHPNIIQVYNCFTDMVEDASGTNQPMTEGRINVRFRRLQVSPGYGVRGLGGVGWDMVVPKPRQPK